MVQSADSSEDHLLEAAAPSMPRFPDTGLGGISLLDRYDHSSTELRGKRGQGGKQALLSGICENKHTNQEVSALGSKRTSPAAQE